MAKKEESKENENTKEGTLETCGIIMPISGSESYSGDHWAEVKDIISECIRAADFEARLVSEASETGTIHQRIVENIYANPIIVCDISSRNPNVMFELGIRLTFDKPVVIIKDDQTDRIFDTDIIEYLSYPKNLRYASIQRFKKNLTDKIKATYNKYKDPETSFFIRNFSNVKAQKLKDEELNSTQIILRAIESLKVEKVNQNRSPRLPKAFADEVVAITDDALIDTLDRVLNIDYGGDFAKFKSKPRGVIGGKLRGAFFQTYVKEGQGVLTTTLEQRINNLVDAVLQSNDVGEVSFRLSFT